MKQTKTSVLRDIFSASSGHLSSKRILGAIVLLTCLIVVVFRAHSEGITDNIKDLFEWFIATSTALLGITSITNIWKSNAVNKNKKNADM